ncbi:hypothetical protein GCM10022199_16210 [Marihabitans asiaticum]|uniref:Uncharacterized protein n=1 Tax=Marihabitans asiaticum TaxID=415218 RepID=A0A560W7V8_9MICO|nr:hypothetical protein [Marihabitans asiaticum]TWD13691.1 hypothetical protein FB557_2321 [Marihabitans asiaticum]
MITLATFLVGIGVIDLTSSILRAGPRGGSRPVLASLASGWVALLVSAGLTGQLTGWSGWLLTALAGGFATAWALITRRALDRGAPHLLPLLVLALGVLVLVVLAGFAPPSEGGLSRWIGWAGLPWQPTPERAALLAGLALVQLSTGNVVVRLVLVSTGAMQADPRGVEPAEELKGGRVLGPLERLFILGLGLAGEVTAAGLVIAAKGLIRWPELKAHSEDAEHPIDKVTEYFLVGSFVSWLVALVALVLASG